MDIRCPRCGGPVNVPYGIGISCANEEACGAIWDDNGRPWPCRRRSEVWPIPNTGVEWPTVVIAFCDNNSGMPHTHEGDTEIANGTANGMLVRATSGVVVPAGGRIRWQ